MNTPGRQFVPHPINEPVRQYAPGDANRSSLQSKLKAMAGEKIEIPCVIGGKEVRTGNIRKVVMPHAHGHVLAEFHLAGAKELEQAADAAARAKSAWESLAWTDRAGVFLKAADLLAGSHRDILNASTMLGQSKNVFQAEIDAACELIDFFRFNAHFYQQIISDQPFSPPGSWNRMEYRPLEGFVAAITPFNFTSIAANLPATPAMLGNTVVWKPSDTQVYSAWYLMKLFEAAGLPPGVINFVPADGPLSGQVLLGRKDLAGVHFTGSTATFQNIWKTVGNQIGQYATYPRLVGETGGKDFVFAHPSAHVEALAVALVRGAFEFQGQKCSAASRSYIPRSIWNKTRDLMVDMIKTITLGDVQDFSHFMNAVIDERSFKKIMGYIESARTQKGSEILTGGQGDSSKGYFIQPTLIQCEDPRAKTMVEEIFGPVLSVHVYDDTKLDDALKLCDESTPYGLTGAIFAQDRQAVAQLSHRLRNSAGNFYINDKPTGAVVGQQPFGGARASGTNDKAGSAMNLYRWLSGRVTKETFQPPTQYKYPFQG